MDTIQDGSLEDWDAMIDINVKGLLYVSKAIIPNMIASKSGHIINIGSTAGKEVYPKGNVYCASKHAVIGLTRSVAKEQGPNNIRVNAVCPSATTGRMMTSIEGRMLPEDAAGAHELVEGTIPMGRYAQPAEVASMVTYLCSDEAAFLTGGAYTVDGGVTA